MQSLGENVISYIMRAASFEIVVVGTLIEHTAGIITSGSRFPCKTGQRLSAIGAKESTEEKVLIIGTRWSKVRGLGDLLFIDSLYLLKQVLWDNWWMGTRNNDSIILGLPMCGLSFLTSMHSVTKVNLVFENIANSLPAPKRFAINSVL